MQSTQHRFPLNPALIVKSQVCMTGQHQWTSCALWGQTWDHRQQRDLICHVISGMATKTGFNHSLPSVLSNNCVTVHLFLHLLLLSLFSHINQKTQFENPVQEAKRNLSADVPTAVLLPAATPSGNHAPRSTNNCFTQQVASKQRSAMEWDYSHPLTDYLLSPPMLCNQWQRVEAFFKPMHF